MLEVIVLVAQLSLGFSDNQKLVEWFKTAKIGDTFGYSKPAGDGCNMARGSYRKVSDTEIVDQGVWATTTVACSRMEPRIKVEVK